MAPALGNGKICYLEIRTADVARSQRDVLGLYPEPPAKPES